MTVQRHTSSSNHWDIRRITIEDALPIRHCVLWPNKPLEHCRVEEDESGEHYGLFVDGRLVSVASIFISEQMISDHIQRAARLRKFATLEEYQGKGIGTFVLQHIMSLLKQHSVDLFWCDARESAMSLYEKFGMSAQGERFYKGEISYRKMSVIVARSNG